MRLHTFSKGGIHPKEHKLTDVCETQMAPLPAVAYFMLNQHIGAPAHAVVKKGDKVKVGTLLAEATGMVSAPVYSSVSGTVVKIDTLIDATGYRQPMVAVEVEGDEWESYIDRSERIVHLNEHPELTPEKIIEAIRHAGVTGMGGAGFPTHVKLMPPAGTRAECVILNGVECEPYITSDYRLMIEHTEEILIGLELLMLATHTQQGYVGIEENKPLAIEKMRTQALRNARVQIVPLKQKYPQGGEKQLVDAVLNKQIPAPPAIPVHVGAIVVNVGTAFAVYEAVMKNKPLIERYTTVTGKKLSAPGNFKVRIGTPMENLIAVCGGLPQGENKVIAGGPMMGKALMSTQIPICKGTNCITVLTQDDAHRKAVQPCIRCAKCVSVCPMGLEPYLLSQLAAHKAVENLEQACVTLCIACGSCQYTCPAHRPLLDHILQGKGQVMAMIKSRNKQ